MPAYVDVMGASILPLTNTVTVNGQTAYRNQEYFRAQIPANNSGSALWTNITVVGGQAVTGNVFVAREPEVFKYDADGNLTNDGRWSYTWDGENRLIQMTVNTNVGPQYELKFAYDSKGRRIQKIVLTNGVPEYTNDFAYDGWNLIAALNSPSSIVGFTVKLEALGPQIGGETELHYMKECGEDKGAVHADQRYDVTFGDALSAGSGVGVSGSIGGNAYAEFGLEADSSGADGYITFGYSAKASGTVNLLGANYTFTHYFSDAGKMYRTPRISW